MYRRESDASFLSDATYSILNFTDSSSNSPLADTTSTPETSPHWSDIIPKTVQDKTEHVKEAYYEALRKSQKFRQYSVLLDVLKDMCFDEKSCLSKELKEKCMDKFLWSKLIKQDETTPGLFDALGIDQPEVDVLSEKEKKQIREIFVNEVGKKSGNNMQDLDTQEERYILGTFVSEDEMMLLDAMMSIVKKFKSAYSSQDTTFQFINDILSLRITEREPLFEQRLKTLNTKLELLISDSKRLRDFMKISVISEDKNVKLAMEKLTQQWHKEHERVTSDLDIMKKKKTNYEALKGTKYDLMVKEYRDITENMKKLSSAMKEVLRSE